jgi:hypothetical protein
MPSNRGLLLLRKRLRYVSRPCLTRDQRSTASLLYRLGGCGGPASGSRTCYLAGRVSRIPSPSGIPFEATDMPNMVVDSCH